MAEVNYQDAISHIDASVERLIEQGLYRPALLNQGIKISKDLSQVGEQKPQNYLPPCETDLNEEFFDRLSGLEDFDEEPEETDAEPGYDEGLNNFPLGDNNSDIEEMVNMTFLRERTRDEIINDFREKLKSRGPYKFKCGSAIEDNFLTRRQKEIDYVRERIKQNYQNLK